MSMLMLFVGNIIGSNLAHSFLDMPRVVLIYVVVLSFMHYATCAWVHLPAKQGSNGVDEMECPEVFSEDVCTPESGGDLRDAESKSSSEDVTRSTMQKSNTRSLRSTSDLSAAVVTAVKSALTIVAEHLKPLRSSHFVYSDMNLRSLTV